MTEPEAMTADGAALTLWREAASLDGLRTAAVGAFACDDARAGAALLARAADRLRTEGFAAVVGPMDGDTWARYRLVIESDGRAPFLMEPQNPDHYPDAFAGAGWSMIGRYASAESAIKPPPADDRPPLARLRSFDPGRAEEELAWIHALSLQAFAGNFLYQALSGERFLASYRPVLAVLDPELVLMAEDDEGALIGFLFALPDMADPSPDRAVILKTYASLKPGVGSQLGRVFTERAAGRGYGRMIHALFHDDNLSARHSANREGRVFRRYGLWGLKL